MIVIIQCAATKSSNAGQFKTSSGQLIKFVADPSAAPPSNCLYARPDDASEQGPSWRQLLLQYNGRTGENPFGLLQALDLYENPAYGRLADKFGIENTYILSAGWGLIAGSFLTPDYDITFSQSADGYKRRRRSDFYRDLCMLPLGTSDPIFFFGGKDYIPLFATLTQSISA